MKELLTLRNGELKFFDSDALRLKDRMFTQKGFHCVIRPDRRLELQAKLPAPLNCTYKFESEKEQLSWFDAIQQKYA